MKILNINFFEQDTDTVAKELLGKILHFYNFKAIICETESYDENDPASHSYGGKITKRNKVMFEEPGLIYVYLIYGVYYCLNFVTEYKGKGSAVLVRAIFLPESKNYINGPGRLCKYLNITKLYNGHSVVNNKDIYIVDDGNKYLFDVTPRIGITKGKELLRRFVIKKGLIY